METQEFRLIMFEIIDLLKEINEKLESHHAGTVTEESTKLCSSELEGSTPSDGVEADKSEVKDNSIKQLLDKDYSQRGSEMK